MDKFKKTKVNKFTSVFLSATTAIMLSGAAALMPVAVQAQTVAELQAQISALLAQITQLQAQLSGLSGGGSSSSVCGFTFSTDLELGDAGTDVLNLQRALNANGVDIASSGPGSKGNETSYFGSLTKAGVVRFQNKYASEVLTPIGLINGTGYVGSMSRAKLNSLFGTCTPGTPGTGGTTPTPTGTGLSVSAASSQPSATLAPQSAARLPFTKIVVTAGSDGAVTITNVEVERTGLAQDAVFAGIVLLDEDGKQLGIAKTLNSNHKVTIGESLTIPAGTSKTLTIAGNMGSSLSTYAGQVAYLSVTGVSTSATVSGMLPITGAGHTINATLDLGSVTVQRGSTDPGSSQSAKEIGTVGYTFSGIKLTAGSEEKVRLQSMRWYQSGSAASSDLENVKTYIGGVAYDTTISSDGKYYTSTFNGGVVLDKGNSVDISLRGDIVGGAGRTIDFDVYKTTDVYATGETYGYGITPPNGTDTSGTDDGAFHQSTNPWYDAFQVTVSSGTMSVSAANNTTPAQNIAENLADQPLGSYEVDVRGEEISVSQTVFQVTAVEGTGATTGQVADITNVSIYDANGNVVAGPVDGSGAAPGGTLTFTDTITYPVGKSVYTLKGKLGTDFENNQTVQASTTPGGSNWTGGSITGLTTGNTITPTPDSAITMSQMTMKTGSLTVSVSSIPIAQTVIAGSSQFLFANYIFDATSAGEDIRVTTIPLAVFVGTAAYNELTNCKLYDGSTVLTTGSNIVNPTAVSSSTTFTFDGNGLILTKGSAKTVGLKCDVASGISAGDVFMWGLDSGQQTTYTGATGLTSGQTVTETLTESAGQVMTGATGGTLSVTTDNDSPGYTIVSSGSTGVTLAKIKYSAVNEDVNIKQVALQLSSVASNTPIDLVGRKVTLWDGATQVGEAVFPTTDYATSTLTASFIVPRDSYKVLTVKGDIAGISVSGPLTASGDLLKVNYDGDNTGVNGNYGTGLSSGGTISGGSTDSDTSGVRIMKAYPTLAKLSISSTLLQTGSDRSLYRFSVKANGDDLALYKLTFNVSSSSVSATTSAYSLYAYTDSGYSTADTNFSSTGLVNANSYYNGLGAQSTTADGQRTVVEIYPNKSSATTTYTIGSGVTRYFELRATVANVESGTGTEYITVRLEGDAAYPITADTLMETVTQLSGDTHNDFIWTPISTTTSVGVGDLDYTNGYSVIGLPGTNMSAETLTSSN